jgi:outer membrane protein TolC
MKDVRGRFGAWVAVSAVAVAVVGCIPSQKKEIATYRKVIDSNAPATTRTTTDLPVDRPLTLEDALILSNRNNEQLAISGESYLQALINKQRAFSAFLPDASLSAGFSHSQSELRGRSRDSSSSTVGAGYNLFNGFRDIAELRRSEFVIEQRRAQLLDLQASLMLNVVTEYYNVLRAEQSVRVLQSSLGVQTERVRDTQARVNLQASKPLDLAQSQAQLAATRGSLRSALAIVRNARARLALLLGVDMITEPLADHYETPDNILPRDRFETLAIAYRQDLRAARQAVLAARQGIKSAVGEYFPTVNVNFNYFLYNDPSSNSLWSSGISGSIPLFRGGQIEADIRSAWSIYRQAGLNESFSRRSILQNLRVIYEDLQTATDQIRDRLEQVRAAEQSLDLAERTYKLGAGSNLDRLIAQNAVDSARLDLINDVYNQKTDYLTLLRTAGLLTPSYPAVPVPTTLPTTQQAVTLLP